MIYRHIFINQTVLDKIRQEVHLVKLKETGGPLVGYISEDNALVVVDAGGPGPKAKFSFFNITIDGEHAQFFCDKVYRESEGLYDYVGDWHRHMCFSLSPSTDDVNAMIKIASFEYCPVKNPISLIYRRFPEGVAIYTLNDDKELEFTEFTILDC